MKIYLIRHGQTTGDLEDRYGGDYDDQLSDEGRQQALGLAEKLKKEGVQVIVHSPKIRAKETAEYLKAAIGCEAHEMPDLRERNQYGVLTGMIKTEAKEKYPDLVEKVKDYRNKIDGAESYEDFSKRMDKVFDEITNMGGYATIAVITHGGPIRFLFREILKAGEIDVADCAFAVLNSYDNQLTVERLEGIEQRTD